MARCIKVSTGWHHIKGSGSHIPVACSNTDNIRGVEKINLRVKEARLANRRRVDSSNVRKHVLDARPILVVHALSDLLLREPCKVLQIRYGLVDLSSEYMCFEEEDLFSCNSHRWRRGQFGFDA